jgi:hypothetical protein
MEKEYSQNKYKLRKDIVYRVVDGEAIILDVGSGEHFSLNKTATEVFICLDQNRPISSLLAEQAGKYRENEKALKADTACLIKKLLEKNIIISKGGVE